ncbi:MAG: hypothetical protein H0V82_11505 [Candidatus Protochlamydia sp.]|nr:hypothetical protein [Candidatus Protochlamydia sp.]
MINNCCNSLCNLIENRYARAIREDLQLDQNAITQKNHHAFCFPNNYFITLNNQACVDLSNIKIDLSNIFIGGIGYGSSSTKLMSRAMRDIGSEGVVFNLPYCIEGCIEENFYSMRIFNTLDQEITTTFTANNIEKVVKKGFTHINIPLCYNGHASLVTIALEQKKAALRFYDSLSPEDLSYDKRYNDKVINFIKSFLPDSIYLAEEKPIILHLLHQGDKMSAGCGYYALFTALLLKDCHQLRNLKSFSAYPLCRESDDEIIRADLVARTLLSYGLDIINTKRSVLYNNPREGIFHKIDFEIINLISQLRSRVLTYPNLVYGSRQILPFEDQSLPIQQCNILSEEGFNEDSIDDPDKMVALFNRLSSGSSYQFKRISYEELLTTLNQTTKK